jgi:phage terminase Nu1 subunit (DNA packaging protein)
MAQVNQAAFAALHGVSRKTVTAWKARGWLVLQGEQVDVEASDARLKKYRREGLPVVTYVNFGAQGNSEGNKGNSQGNKGNSQGNNLGNRKGNKQRLLSVQPGERAEDAAVRILSVTGADMDYDEARRVKENYLALLHQLDYNQKSGAVVAIADVAQAVGEEYAKVRTRLLAIPSECAPRLHALKTVAEVQDMLQAEIVEALEALTRDA